MEENRKLKVYLETSFVSYLTGGPTLDAKVAADQAFTRLWWESERGKADVFVSGYTIAECEAGDQEHNMNDTSLLDEVRATRRLIASECDNDLKTIAEHAANAARRFRRLVNGRRAQNGNGRRLRRNSPAAPR